MFFYSTRNQNQQITLSQAIRHGLADDGGLFVPQYFPQITLEQLDPQLTYAQFAATILAEYFRDDLLSSELANICQRAFTFPLELKSLNSNTFILELFHGPTLSFKDFGARFLAECLSYLSAKQKTTILVATSGDTGSAVASAFYRKANIEVIILFPKGQISPRQEQQISCWGDNVTALAVNGSFDDCQKLVKEALNDSSWKALGNLSSANSINIARLLAQITYYAYTSWKFILAQSGNCATGFDCTKSVGFIIPTGNVGNATAAFWAKAMGFPIGEIVLATNQNRVISDYLAHGKFTPRPSINTIANAMDVGNPSNFERLSSLYNNEFAAFKNSVRAFSVSDAQIRETIVEMQRQFNYIVCPHTATACFAARQLEQQPWIIAATADPCKFNTIIEPIIKGKLPIAAQLKSLLNLPSSSLEINANLSELNSILENKNHATN